MRHKNTTTAPNHKQGALIPEPDYKPVQSKPARRVVRNIKPTRAGSRAELAALRDLYN